MNYQSFSVEDFVMDQYFRTWIRNPDSSSDKFWNDYIRENPNQVWQIDQAKKVILAIPESRHTINPTRETELWNQIKSQIQSESSVTAASTTIDSSEKTKVKKHKSWFGSTLFNWKVAASVILLMVGLAAFWYLRTDFTFNSQETEMVIKENPYGQRSTIYLSDGTEVMLNAGSRVSYPKEFSSKERVVKLTGEAFFRVARDEARPFRVFSQQMVTEALGTSFNIQAYQDQSLQISLITGKVSVKDTSSQQELLLTPGECALLDTAREILVKDQFDERQVLAWKEGIIYFKNASQETVFNALEKWYGVNIQVKNEPSEAWNYTGQLQNMSLDQFLETLQFSMNFQYEIENKNVKITYP